MNLYNLYKFVILATQNNPNILELLFIDDKYIDIIKPEFQEIRKHRDLFLSAKCRFTYCKYAFSQLKRIKGHKRWLDNPPKQVKRSDYNLLEHEKLFDNKSLQSLMDNFINEIKGGLINGVAEFYQVDKNDDLNNMISDILSGVSQQYFKNFALQYFTKQGSHWVKDGLKDVMIREIDYYVANRTYQQYTHWRENRNPARAKLEEKYHYDLKHSTHLTRLLKNAEQILKTGTLNVDVSQDQEVWAVKNGDWTYEQLIEWAEKKDKELDQIYENKEYVVQHSPQRDKIEELYLNIIKKYI